MLKFESVHIRGFSSLCYICSFYLLLLHLLSQGSRQGMHFDCMNNTSSLKRYTVFHHPTFNTGDKSVAQVIVASAITYTKCHGQRTTFPSIWWSLTDCFVIDNLPHGLFGTVANDTCVHFCIHVTEIAQAWDEEFWWLKCLRNWKWWQRIYKNILFVLETEMVCARDWLSSCLPCVSSF